MATFSFLYVKRHPGAVLAMLPISYTFRPDLAFHALDPSYDKWPIYYIEGRLIFEHPFLTRNRNAIGRLAPRHCVSWAESVRANTSP